MLGSHGFPRNSLVDVKVFQANSPATGTGWARWARRPGCTMVSMYVVGGGCGGGNGAVGAASNAAGGGGGGSSGATYVECMAFMLPEVLFVSVGFGGAANAVGIKSYVSIYPDTTVANLLCSANVGGAGGNAAGATAGAAGAAAGSSGITSMPLAGPALLELIGGQAGIIGGTTVAGAALAYSVNGHRNTGGTGGGGLPASGVGKAGGAITGAGVMDAVAGALGGSTTLLPAANGSNGYAVIQPYGFWNGGTGGSSTHATAVTTGLVGGNGGTGGIGSGGGGGGGALTGSTQGLGGRGGDGLVIITSW